MKSAKRNALALAVIFAASSAWCGDLLAPFSLDSAGVLPPGVRSIRFGGFTSEFNGAYNNSGHLEPLGQGFNKGLTWGQLLDSRQPGIARAKMKGAIASLAAENEDGFGLNDFAGDTHGLINSRVSVSAPAFAYGLTERWTIAAAIPIVHSSTNVSTGWTPNERFMKVWNTFTEDPDKRSKMEEIEPDIQNVVATELASKGYKPLRNERRTELGDVALVSKYQILRTKTLAVALQQRLSLPTGRTADVDKLVDVAPGDGQYDIGIGSFVDFDVTKEVTLTQSLTYVAQLPDTKAKRIPVAPGETLTPDVDPSTKEDLGDVVSTSLGGRVRLAELYTFGAAHNLQYKSPDRYSGSKFASERYSYLEHESEQYMQATTLGFNFSTVPLFRKSQFAVPMELSLNHAQIWDGRNVKRNGLTSAEMVMYF